ncbi:class I SAM-dependent methyltransferase [Lysinibacter sp. HNR]|uniref:class I SAM-dependent methyltransferase n=1 Tax=Lysinibacter sp. HNR TaxID=3031408 RepID=UPI00243504DD|nr:class I SAM-dependent methyltransferase [Lysinibacter sp. HNR]WGD38525.1 class I SAM-dependent methyltransferase [Lysinibacter sp. HNR]
MSASKPEHIADELLKRQIQYYSDRAPVYNDWWLRKGSFDQGDELNRVWFDDINAVSRVLEDTELGQECIELAPGTGMWSVKLAPRVARLTLVDGSHEMLRYNPVVAEPNVRVEIANLFEWQPSRTYDSVVFSLWVSHIPEERLDGFFQLVSNLLVPGGAIFFIENLQGADSASCVEGGEGETSVRPLNDGRTATIVKNFFSDERLTESADTAGIDLQLLHTKYFLVGQGTKR